MMAIRATDITSEFTIEELKILDNLLSEREVESTANIGKVDPHKYIKLLELRSKVKGLINLIEHKQESDKKMATKSYD